MPWKMVFFLAVLALVVFFAGFNITNVSDISCGFYTITNVPIFISLFMAFVVGTLVMIPFVGKRKSRKKAKEQVPENSAPLLDENIPELPELDEQSPRIEKNKKK